MRTRDRRNAIQGREAAAVSLRQVGAKAGGAVLVEQLAQPLWRKLTITGRN